MRLTASHLSRTATLFLLFASSLAGGAAASASAPSDAGVTALAVAAAARATPAGGRLRLDDVEVPATSERLSFDLERFEVWSDDAVVVVHSRDGEERLPAPRTRYFRGTVTGEPGSRVFVEVREDGVLRGIVDRPGDAMYLIDSANDAAPAEVPTPLRAERADAALLKVTDGHQWSCQQQGSSQHGRGELGLGVLDTPAAEPKTAATIEATGTYTARLAIETDHEYFLKFGTINGALDYVGELLGYASAIYQAETAANLLVSHVSLWTSAGDPWTLESTCGLVEFGRYWNLNRTNVKRTIAHFLSGKATNSGIAWIGVLCAGAFDSTPGGITAATCPTVTPPTTNWGGGYGFTGGIDGNFDVDTPTVIWDIAAVMHEIGHNFNSPHTHCYNGIDNPAPIDQCHTGEAAFGCNATGPVLPGPVGAGTGTIMSYCHLLGGGFSNVSLNFGTGHPWGVLPARQATRMSAHVAAMAGANPACLAPTFFDNGFEEGALVSPGGRWSGKTP